MANQVETTSGRQRVDPPVAFREEADQVVGDAVALGAGVEDDLRVTRVSRDIVLAKPVALLFARHRGRSLAPLVRRQLLFRERHLSA
jgi:hypothetical protein